MIKRRIVILGAGESGIGSAVLASKLGIKVFLSDNNLIKPKSKDFLNKLSIQYEEGGHTTNKLMNSDYIIKSPGISNDLKIIKKLKLRGKKIISEIEFASKHTNAKLIGITGSNGKTTTALLTYEILKRAGFNVCLAGNIGFSFARQVAEKNYDYYVLEISSFQLDDIVDFAPEFAVITNITPDHLDRYNNNFEEYVKSKIKISKNQTDKDFLLFNSEDLVLKKIIKKSKIKAKQLSFSTNNILSHTYIHKNKMMINNLKNKTMINTSNFPLVGRHNLLNAMAASTIANILEISKENIRESLLHFKGAPHRLEKVLTIQKVNYINDSKATNVNATFFALDSLETSIIWIVGGVDKGNDYFSLLPLVRKKVNGIICLGLDNFKLIETFEGICEKIIETESISEAVKIAHKLASPRETVLLSPACASFDLFKNFEDRGNQFKAAVRNL